MKYFSLLLLFMTSCNYYNPNYILKISGLSKGRLVISDVLEIRDIELKNSNDYVVTLKKGGIYSITHYPDFYGRPSNFPSGTVITNPKTYITLSPHLGLLSQTINDLHRFHYEVDYECVLLLSEKFLDEVDVWRFKRSDCIDYLLGNMKLSNIKGYDTFIISELTFLFSYISDNRLLREWYPGIFSFFNVKNYERIIVEIYDNGEFCTLISR